MAEINDGTGSWVSHTLAAGFLELREALGPDYPAVLYILGNDDGKAPLAELEKYEAQGLWTHLHGRWRELQGTRFYGYAYVPPSPFLLKDWERYDVSRYTPPGCVSPEEGRHADAKEARDARFATIQADLEAWDGQPGLEQAVFLFHTPPYESNLDRAGLDGRMVEHVPLDLHVGSIAVRRFLEKHGPRVSLHGHIHESVRLMGDWRDRVGQTLCFGGAHDGPELALVRFDTDAPENATRDLL
jgi:Icc-related predicted phosphoesterase